SCTRPRPTYTASLSLHDALPIFPDRALASRIHAGSAHDAAQGVGDHERASLHVEGDASARNGGSPENRGRYDVNESRTASMITRSEEHTSELQSRENLVCRLLLE